MGLRHHIERGERERMIGRRARLLADGHHRPLIASSTTSSNATTRIVDDRQACGDAAPLDLLAVAVAEAGGASAVHCCGPPSGWPPSVRRALVRCNRRNPADLHF